MSKKQRRVAGLYGRTAQIGHAVDKAKETSRAQVSRSVNTTRKAIQKRPLTAVGVATGAAVAVGIIAGVSLARRGKDTEPDVVEDEED
jgi:ElaB/YqjD/DUF883 family membrane-anchored ribosome-binding protein